MRKYIFYITELLFLVYILMFNNVITNNFLKYVDIINILFFGILALIVYFCFGFPKNKKVINYSVFQTMIIWFIIYYFLIYTFGLFFGFVKNPYSLTFLNIIKNVSFVSLFYIFREIFRYIVINQSNKRKKNHIIIVTILFILLDIIMEVKSFDLNTAYGIFEFIEKSVITNIAINIFASYVLYKLNIKVVLLFLLGLILPTYCVPLFSNLGSYLETIFLVVFIFILYYQSSLIIEKYERNVRIKKEKSSKLSLVILIIPIIIFVGVVSGVFKYHLFAIVSNSMVPEFSRGDAVLVEKLKTDELNKLKTGDVLAFYNDNKIVVHRIVEIKKTDNNYYIKTKGDNNGSVDPWLVRNDNIYGKVLFSIKYIGIPSVELSDLIDG